MNTADVAFVIALCWIFAFSIPSSVLDDLALYLRPIWNRVVADVISAICWPIGIRARVYYECVICGVELSEDKQDRLRHMDWHEAQGHMEDR